MSAASSLKIVSVVQETPVVLAVLAVGPIFTEIDIVVPITRTKALIFKSMAVLPIVIVAITVALFVVGTTGSLAPDTTIVVATTAPLVVVTSGSLATDNTIVAVAQPASEMVGSELRFARDPSHPHTVEHHGVLRTVDLWFDQNRVRRRSD